ncbi:ferric reductase-like transmembrane domain-containing protein [Streptomyces oceani]|uniref:Iron reductase n=1 Tax=Streptomyces oceani TaxID=1075402 RepID=A0A1E7JWB9_9ACTN|nr:ferric reductase-like transmembrane domain-containing protein [Streptomyces oceani]OEU95954.1 iron reductase [Streptomyces oceani]
MHDGQRTRQRRWFDFVAFRRDVRAALVDATAALIVTLVVFVWLHWRIETGSSMTLQVMPMLADADTYWMYWMCEAFGWSGLLWAWITVMLGLIRSSRRLGWLPVSVARIEKWHRTTSLTTIALMFAHAFWLFAEFVRANEDQRGWGGRTWSAFVDTFVPGAYASGTGRVAILIGLLAFYLAIPLGLAFYARRSIGVRTWRVLHASILVVYVLSVWHTLLYGTNVWYDGWFRTTVWLLQLPVAALLLARLLAPARRPGRRGLDLLGRAVGRACAAASIVMVLAVAASGRDGGRTPGVDGAGLSATRTMVWIGLGVFIAAVVVCAYRAHRLTPTRQARAEGEEDDTSPS